MGTHLSKTLKEIIHERSNDYTALEKQYLKITEKSPLQNLITTHKLDSSSSLPTVSIIIPAYNVQDPILACLASIEQSNFNILYRSNLQVIVIDDGSTDDTWRVIKNIRLSLNLTGIRQNHHSAAHARNTGISIADGSIIISCDADMVLSYYAIDQLVARHQQMPNVLLAGFRCEVSKTDHRVDFNYIKKYGSHHDSYFAKDERITYSSPGWPSNMCLASNHYKSLGYGRGLWMPDSDDWEDMWTLPDLVYGCLFSLSRDAYINIKGYDERFYGWGCEEGFLAAKAFAAGQYIVPVYSASGLHIKHAPRTKNKHIEYEKNRKLFHKLINTSRITDYPDWITKAKKRIVESFVHNSQETNSKLIRIHPAQEETSLSLEYIDNILAIGDYYRVLELLSAKTYKEEDKIFRQGKALIGIGKYESAICVLKNSVDLHPDSTIDLAIAQAAIGQFLSSRLTLKKLSEINPEASGLHYWYKISAQEHIRQGIKYIGQEFYDIARRCFEAALIIEPNNKTALKYRKNCMAKKQTEI